jgi:hypothetical protein
MRQWLETNLTQEVNVMLFQFIVRDELRQQSIIAIHEIGVVVVLLAAKNHRHHPAQAEFATVNEQPGGRRFGALPDSCGDGARYSGRGFQTFRIRGLDAPFQQKAHTKIMDGNAFAAPWLGVLA